MDSRQRSDPADGDISTLGVIALWVSKLTLIINDILMDSLTLI